MREAITAFAVAALLFAATCGGHTRNAARTSGLTPEATSPTKTASIIPADERLVARDAGIALSGGGYTLTWKYENPGDYGQDGKAGVEDVTPIAQHFGEAVSPENEWIKVNGTGVIGVSEITPIAMNWASEVTGYRIDGADAAEGPWNEMAQITLEEGDTANGRLAFSDEIAPGNTYYRIVTLTPEGDAAFTDNLIAPSNEPVIYGVSPMSGYQHEEYTFTATASGQEPLTYAWDFGGGASPNTSSAISPTVTLSDSGEYSATLTISNSYGPTSFPFTLSVTARDMWSHTWGGSLSDEAVDICTDGEGNIYVVGKTQSFSAGEEDTLVLKYASDGTLLWARTWGGQGYDSAVGIAVLSIGGIAVGGRTTSFGSGMDDIYILIYSPDGTLISQKAWGTSGYEVVNDLAVDGDDNLYFAGYQFYYGGFPTMFVAKLNTNGSSEWALTWGLEGNDRASCLTVDQLGNVYVAGMPDMSSASYDTALVKFSADGLLLWSKRWGGEGIEGANGITTDSFNQVYLVGGTTSFGAGSVDAFVLKLDNEGGLLFAKTWGTSTSGSAGCINASTNGTIYISGYIQGLTTSIQGVLLSLDPSGELLLSSALQEYSWLASISIDAVSNLIFVGASNNSNCTWGSVAGEFVDVSAGVEDYNINPIALEGTSLDVIGTESFPSGTEDTGGGEIESLVIKNFPH